MNLANNKIKCLAFSLLLLTLGGCSDNGNEIDKKLSHSAKSVQLDVFKSETCGCCKDWVEHIENAGFETTIHHPQDLNKVKAGHAVAPQYQSCHTAVDINGYVFEGHIPAKHIRAFLNNPPDNALGLAVPGMPVGSPGMEVGDKFSPYKVLLLKPDGSNQVFAKVATPSQQYD